MEDLVENLANGNVTAVKIVLASVIMALAVYQVVLMAVGWGKVKLPFLKGKPASFAHRAVGDTIVTITIVVAFMCLAYFGVEDGIEHARPGETDRAVMHVVAAFALLAVLAFKIVVVRWWHRLGKYLPVIGLTVFALFLATWLTSAGDYLLGG